VNLNDLLRRGDRVEGLHVGSRTCSWVSVVVDERPGYLLVDREWAGPANPQIAVPEILAARVPLRRVWRPGGNRDESRPVVAGPEKLIGTDPWETKQWRPTALRDVFGELGLRLSSANEDAAVGLEHALRLWMPHPELPFPDWHEKAGQTGSRMLFVSADCPRTKSQLESVLLAEDDEPNPGGQPSPRWEAAAGGLFAAVRYACLFARNPSKTVEVEPESGLRERLFWEAVEAREQKAEYRTDYPWA
jgi:hypothetical protein